ncbi:PREDICTED: uncharacterized protein LOC108767426 [Trachymyrmex cornetzi]|uniref:uncharacterized protein LOC108767426 n=1 Tax=Trachymyrmex cornetzi TaxID=471704 RepID=UPI00084EDCC9|nr:PREDICTED: uncharacterized protein LOC108767426 [Trachymyrmex cornetzi]
MAFRNLLTCFVCNNRYQPRLMRRIDGENNDAKRDIAILRRDNAGLPALEVNDQTRLCMNCNISILEEIDLILQDERHMRLNVLTQTRSASCLICDQEDNVERLCMKARVNIFITSNIYIPNNVRSCRIHLDGRGFLLQPLHAGLRSINRPYVIKGQELQEFINELRNNALSSSKYEDEEDFDDEEFHAMTSLTKEQFRDLFSFCDRIPVQVGFEYITKNNLLLFLTKMRHGISDNALEVIFKYSSRQVVSYVIDKVRKSLLLRFVKENIGFQSITRDAYIQQHVTDFANVLYNLDPNVPEAIGYVDGTYSYIEESSNFRVLRQSFSLHKGRYLIKLVLVVAPDGYILDIQGPYFSDSRNNDAALLRDQL